jgi:hypothetical protein
MDYSKIYRIAQWVAHVMWVALVIVTVILAIGVSQKNKTLKRMKAERYEQTEMLYKANMRADSLAKLDCITVNSTIVINQKGLVNLQQANQISRSVATYTRDEVLQAIDSMYKTK